jgi:copper chaperone CopZ
MRNTNDIRIQRKIGASPGVVSVVLLVLAVFGTATFACGTFCFWKEKRTSASPVMASQLSAGATDSGKAVAKEQRIVLKVEGMTCGSCEHHVRKALNKVPGVKDAKANAKENKAEVVYDTSMAKAGDLLNAVNKAGYKASLPDSGAGS